MSKKEKFIKTISNDKIFKLVVVALAFMILNTIVYLMNDFEITIIFILSFIESLVIVNCK